MTTKCMFSNAVIDFYIYTSATLSTLGVMKYKDAILSEVHDVSENSKLTR